MNKFVGIVLGLILLLAPIFDWITNSTNLNLGESALTFLKGGIVWGLILVGAIILLVSFAPGFPQNSQGMWSPLIVRVLHWVVNHSSSQTNQSHTIRTMESTVRI